MGGSLIKPDPKPQPSYIGIGKIEIKKPLDKLFDKPLNQTSSSSVFDIRPLVKPAIKGYEIWDENLRQHRSKTEFDKRVTENALELNINHHDSLIHRKRLERFAVEQTASYPEETRKSQQTIPLNHCQSIKAKYDYSKFWHSKYFSTKPKRPELTGHKADHIANVSRPYPTNELLIELDGVQILRKDVQTLLGSNWLNDEIINAYMYLLVCRGKNQHRRSVHAFNTFFYPKLKDSGYSSIRRWTRKVDIFIHDIILVPVHLGNHWCLAVIDNNKRKISYYDSLGGSAGVCCKLLLDYLKDEMNDKKKQCFDKENWSLAEYRGGSGGVPRQENGSDCGVFTCIYAEYITREAKFDFSQRDMPYFRQKMIFEITKGQILE